MNLYIGYNTWIYMQIHITHKDESTAKGQKLGQKVVT